MVRAVVTTGANMGDRLHSLDAARRMIAERAGGVVAQSSVGESEPWGDMDKGAGAFLNQALVIETPLTPEELLDTLQGIEVELGRVRGGGAKRDVGEKRSGGEKANGGRKYLSRTMDIDIIFYGDTVMRTDRLTIPHPLAAQREFVLSLAAEIVPEYAHPVSGTTVVEMLEELKNGGR